MHVSPDSAVAKRKRFWCVEQVAQMKLEDYLLEIATRKIMEMRGRHYDGCYETRYWRWKWFRIVYNGWRWCWHRVSQFSFLQRTLQAMPAPPDGVERGYEFSTRHCLKRKLPVWRSGWRNCRPSTGDFSGHGETKQTAKYCKVFLVLA
jgi:hypothetical protein